MTIITDDWHPFIHPGQGSQNKAHISFATPKLLCFLENIFTPYYRERKLFGMVKVWKCYLWFFTVIWSKYSASKVSLSMEVAMGPCGVVNKWDFKAKRCWEPFQRLPPGSDHRRQTSSWCPRQGSSSWSEERPEKSDLQLIDNWKTQTNTANLWDHLVHFCNQWFVESGELAEVEPAARDIEIYIYNRLGFREN